MSWILLLLLLLFIVVVLLYGKHTLYVDSTIRISFDSTTKQRFNIYVLIEMFTISKVLTACLQLVLTSLLTWTVSIRYRQFAGQFDF